MLTLYHLYAYGTASMRKTVSDTTVYDYEDNSYPVNDIAFSAENRPVLRTEKHYERLNR